MKEWTMNARMSVIAFAIAGLIGCSANRTPEVADKVRNSLKQAGLNDVTVSQDRDKGVVTLAGNVRRQAEKDQADEIAKQLAGEQVVADQINVLPNGEGSAARTVDADLDRGIEANLEAAIAQADIRGISHTTKDGVVTLRGHVETPAQRADVERLAAGVPNVQQVVNEIDVKNQRATTSPGRPK
jgi:hyperosmotically inducible protein